MNIKHNYKLKSNRGFIPDIYYETRKIGNFLIGFPVFSSFQYGLHFHLKPI